MLQEDKTHSSFPILLEIFLGGELFSIRLFEGCSSDENFKKRDSE